MNKFLIYSLALKSTLIVDFCSKSSGFGDFENTGSWISCEFWRGFRIVPVLMCELGSYTKFGPYM